MTATTGGYRQSAHFVRVGGLRLYEDLAHLNQDSIYGCLSEEISGRHRIQGIGAGFVPALLDRALSRQLQQPHDEDAIAMAR